MKHPAVRVLLCLTLTGFALSQQSNVRPKSVRTDGAPAVAVAPPPEARQAAVVHSGLTVADVIGMLEAKMAETVIALKVKQVGKALEPSVAQLVALKKAGASDSLMALLLDPTRTFETSRFDAPPAKSEVAPAADNKPILEIGVYVRKQGLWMELQPEIVNWKQGGVIKSLSTAGVVKKDLNGNIDGPVSRNSVKTPVEILLVTQEGVAASEYQLLRLRVNRDYREFRSVTGGIMNQRSGAMRDLIPFESKKIGPRQFEFVLPPTLGAGEYGLLPPGAGGTSTTVAVSAQSGKMYTFRVME